MSGQQEACESLLHPELVNCKHAHCEDAMSLNMVGACHSVGCLRMKGKPSERAPAVAICCCIGLRSWETRSPGAHKDHDEPGERAWKHSVSLVELARS